MLVLQQRLEQDSATGFPAPVGIVQEIRNRNVQAMEILYDQYAAVIYGYIVRQSATSVDAEDICARTFLRIWKEIDTYDEQKCRLYTWILTLVKDEMSKGDPH